MPDDPELDALATKATINGLRNELADAKDKLDSATRSYAHQLTVSDALKRKAERIAGTIKELEGRIRLEHDAREMLEFRNKQLLVTIGKLKNILSSKAKAAAKAKEKSKVIRVVKTKRQSKVTRMYKR
jgi:hypothetical protein